MTLFKSFLCRPFFWYWIISAFMKWMTTKDTADCQVSAFDGSVFFDSFNAVMGTCWIKSATRRCHWRNEFLIKPEDAYHKEFHVLSLLPADSVGTGSILCSILYAFLVARRNIMVMPMTITIETIIINANIFFTPLRSVCLL